MTDESPRSQISATALAPRANDTRSDQAAADADRRATEGVQDASTRDEAAGDRDHASSADPDSTAPERARDAFRRDEAARLGDVRAIARDRATDARDRAAERTEACLGLEERQDPAMAALRQAAATLRSKAAADRARAGTDRVRAASDRAVADDDRAMAAEDRAMAAEDRVRAAKDRARAADDRHRARIELQHAHVDDLTGLYTRGFGLLQMQLEIDRAHRSGDPFVLAVIDVDGLREVNDHSGHAGGDAVLRAVGAGLRAHQRSYDPIVRVGGDEFVCAFSNTSLKAAARRLEEVKAALERDPVNASISSGLAELHPGETLEGLTARGDAELYRAKGSR